MTKKHFEALALELKDCKPKGTDKQAESFIEQWRRDCLAVAQVCSQFNPRFDWGYFLEACGVRS